MPGIFLVFLTLWSLFPSVASAQVPPVAFSQIKTQGQAADDEFIELINPTEQAFALNGFRLVKETASGNQYTLLTFGQETVTARSYFLIAQEDGRFADAADARYSTVLADNNRVYLLDTNNVIVDTLAWGTISGASLPNPGKTQSLQRTWRDATQTWLPWSATEFVSAATSGTMIDLPEEEQEEEEDVLFIEPVRINETGLWPISGDLPWGEIYNPSTQAADLTGWSLQTDGRVLATFQQPLPEESFATVFWTPGSSSVRHLYLYDASGTLIDDWEIQTAQAVSTSLALSPEGTRLATAAATPGRPNVFLSSNDVTLVCKDAGEPLPDEPTQQPQTPDLPAHGRIRINEVLANPTGDDGIGEFIELYNEETFAVDLTGWLIGDASKEKALTTMSIEPQGFLVLHKTESSLSLNNSDEAVTLKKPNGQLIAQVSYETSTEAQSWNWHTDTWYESVPTPGSTNAPAAASVATEPTLPKNENPKTTASAPTTVPSSAPKQAISAPVYQPVPAPMIQAVVTEDSSATDEPMISRIAAAPDHEENAKAAATTRTIDYDAWEKTKALSVVSLRGIIIATPGMFGEKVAYMQAEDGQGPGVELYSSKEEWPELAVGDVVIATGKRSSIKESRRLLIAAADDIEVIDYVDVVAAAQELDQARHNTLVSVSGGIMLKGKTGIEVTTDGQTIIASLSKAALTAPELLPNSTGTLTGMYRHGATTTIWLRDEQDVVIDQVQAGDTLVPLLDLGVPVAHAATSGALSDGSGLEKNDAIRRNAGHNPWYGLLAAATVLIAGLAYLFKDRLIVYARQAMALIRNRLPL